MFGSGAFNILWLLLFLAVGSLQGGCAIVIALWAFLEWRQGRGYRALPWYALGGTVVLVIGIWDHAAANATFYGRDGTASVLRQLGSEFPLILPFALVPLWLLVALLQYRPGRLYLVALFATLPPATLVGLITGLYGLFTILFGALFSIAWLLSQVTP